MNKIQNKKLQTIIITLTIIIIIIIKILQIHKNNCSNNNYSNSNNSNYSNKTNNITLVLIFSKFSKIVDDDKAQDDLANAEYLNAQTNQKQKKATGQKLNDKSGGNKEPIYDNLNNNKDKQKRKRNKKKKKKGAKVDKENELEDGDLPKEANDSQVRKPEPEAKVIFYPEEENFEELLYQERLFKTYKDNQKLPRKVFCLSDEQKKLFDKPTSDLNSLK